MPPFVFAERFAAHKTTAQLNLTNAKVTWDVVDEISPAFSFNPALNRLTILKPGLYVFIVNLEIENVATTITIQLTRDPISEVVGWSESAALTRAGLATFDRALIGTTYEIWFVSSAIRDITFTAGFWRNRWLAYKVAD